MLRTRCEGVDFAPDRNGIILDSRGVRSQNATNWARRCGGYISLHAISYLPPPTILRARSRLCMKEHLGEAHASRRANTKLKQKLMVTSPYLATNRTVPTRARHQAKSLDCLIENDISRRECASPQSRRAADSQIACMSQKAHSQGGREVVRQIPDLTVDFVNHQETRTKLERNDSPVCQQFEKLVRQYHETKDGNSLLDLCKGHACFMC